MDEDSRKGKRRRLRLDSGIGNIPQRRGTLQIRKAVSEKILKYTMKQCDSKNCILRGAEVSLGNS